MLSDWCSPVATAALIRRNETAGLEAPALRDVRHEPPLNSGTPVKSPHLRLEAARISELT